jgi:hypothetical protein
MKPTTRVGADPTFCNLCGDRYWRWGAHSFCIALATRTLLERVAA